MARGGPSLTKPFDINPIRGHTLPVRGRHRFGGRAGSTITVPGTNPSPDPKEEPLKHAGKRPNAATWPRMTSILYRQLVDVSIVAHEARLFLLVMSAF
jgi:hypothetical protein